MANNILDYFGEQNNLSGLQQWAASGGIQNDPNLSNLAQLAPRAYAEMAPNVIGKQLEQKALQDYYGSNQSPTPPAQAPQNFADGNNGDQLAGAPVPQSIPANPDSALAAYQPPTPPPTPNDPNKRLSALAYLPAALQAQAGQQLMLGGLGDGTTPSIIDKQANAIANYKVAPLSPVQLKTPMGMAVQNAVLDKNPDYDATKYKERQKTANDLSPGGVMGQKISAAETTINHLSGAMDASDKLGGIDAGFLSKPVNAVANYFKNQDPNVIAYNRLSNLAGDETAKFIAGTSGSTEADRHAQEDALTINNSPTARKAAAQTAIQALFSKLEPIADQYNKSYEKNITPADLLSPETKSSLAKLGMLPDGVDSGTSKSALSQVSQPSQQIYVNPQTGQRIQKVNGKWVQAK